MSSSIIYFALTFFITFLNIACFSMDGMYINRVFHNFPVSLIEDSIILIKTDGSFSPYLSKPKVKENVISYLKMSLDSKIDYFEISFNYYEYIDEEEVALDTSAYPKNVDIHFRCTYYLNMNYEGYRNFEIIGEKLYE